MGITAHLYSLISLEGRGMAALRSSQRLLQVGNSLLLCQQRALGLQQLRAQRLVLLRQPLQRLPHLGRPRLLQSIRTFKWF